MNLRRSGAPRVLLAPSYSSGRHPAVRIWRTIRLVCGNASLQSCRVSKYLFTGTISLNIYLLALGWRRQDKDKIIMNFFNGTPYFLLHILVVFFQTFFKHYNFIHFK